MLLHLDAERLELAETDVHALLHLHLVRIQVVVLAPTTAILTILGSEFENAVALDAIGAPFPVSTGPTEETALSHLQVSRLALALSLFMLRLEDPILVELSTILQLLLAPGWLHGVKCLGCDAY